MPLIYDYDQTRPNPSILRAAIINIEEVVDRLTSDLDEIVPEINWFNDDQAPPEIVGGTVSSNPPRAYHVTPMTERQRLCVFPPRFEVIVPPPTYRGKMVVEGPSNVVSKDWNNNGRSVKVFSMGLEPGDDLLPFRSPLSLLGRTTRIHRGCSCKTIRFHSRPDPRSVILQVLVPREKSKEREYHILINNPRDEEVILSRLFSESFVARQALTMLISHERYGEITPELSERARLHSVVFCGELLRESLSSHNAAIAIVGSPKIIRKIAHVVNNQKKDKRKCRGELLLTAHSLKSLTAETANEFQFSWTLKSWLQMASPELHSRWVLVGSPRDKPKELELPGGKRDWTPNGEETTLFCAIRELFEECNIAIPSSTWNECVSPRDFQTERNGAQNFYVLRCRDDLVPTCLDNGVTVLSMPLTVGVQKTPQTAVSTPAKKILSKKKTLAKKARVQK